MHVAEYIPSFQKSVKQRLPVIPLHQFPEHFLPGKAVQQRPYFQHPAGFYIQNILELFFCITPAPLIKPLPETFRDLQRLVIAGKLIHIQQSHKSFVDRILWRPDALAAADPVQIFLRNGSHPFAAVLLLTLLQHIHDLIRLRLQHPVSGSLIMHRRRRKPVSEKMSSQLTRRGFPASVNPFRQFGRLIQSRLQRIRKQ